MNNNSDFPNNSTKEREHFFGISKSIETYIKFKILTNKSSKIIHSLNVRPSDILLDKNICLNPLTIPRIVTFKQDLSKKDASNTTENDESFDSLTNIPILDTSDLVRRNFLMPTDKDGQRL